jgi:hypothetical protein
MLAPATIRELFDISDRIRKGAVVLHGVARFCNAFGNVEHGMVTQGLERAFKHAPGLFRLGAYICTEGT